MVQSDPISFSSLSVAPPVRRAGPLWIGLVLGGAALYATVALLRLGGAVGLALALAVPLGVVAWQFGLRKGLAVAAPAAVCSLGFGLLQAQAALLWLLGTHGVALALAAALGRLHDLDALAARERLEGQRARRLVAQRRMQGEALLEALPDTIIRLGSEGRLLGTGARPPADGGRRLLEDLVPARTADALRECADRVLASGRPEELEYEVRDGARSVDFEARLVPSGEREVLGILREVTSRKRLERELVSAREAALDAARLKTKFLANMSHEIRTPMNGVIGMTNLLRETSLTREQGEYVEIIYKSGHALLEIIDDILDFAKIEAGKLELDRLEFDPRACTYETVEAVAGQAFAKGIDLGTLVGPGVPSTVVGDVNRLRQVLANLLSNAVRYTDRGAVSVNVELASRQGGAQVLRFSVRDTGCGIDPALRGELFQPLLFEDESRAGRDPRRGTGLGLAICRQLVELMEGEIGVHGESEGTCFWFTARLGEPATPARADEVPPADPRGVRVLLVQNFSGRRLLAELLRNFGTVPEVASRDETVARLLGAAREGFPFAAVIVDMPRDPKTALAAVEEVRSEPSLRELPLLAVDEPESASSVLREDLRRAVGRLLSWPLRHDEVFGALTAALGRAKEEPQRRRTQSAELPVAREGLMFGVRVLVAEDNPVNQRVAERSLQLLGCEMAVAPDGRTAVQMARDGHFDAVLMDCQMPELDGFEAARAIRAEEKGTRLPIIAMTANTGDGERARCMEAGMDDFICKPVAVPDLRAVLLRWVSAEVRESSGSQQAHEEPQSEMDVPVGDAIESDVLGKLEALGEDEPGFVQEMIELFVDQTPRNLAAIQAALAVHDLQAVANTAHTLKSSAAYLGAMRLSELCKLVERKARDAEAAAVQRGVAALHAEYERVQKALELRKP